MLLGGGTLADQVRAHGPMNAAMVDYLAGHLLGAWLGGAPPAGIVHRDIKPANVLFDELGHAYLTDFGVATMRDATSGLTATDLVGTPEFMAPEQHGASGPRRPATCSPWLQQDQTEPVNRAAPPTYC